jgi:hypothetical protein
MLSRINSGAVYGVDAYPVEIEVNAASSGDPQTVIVGSIPSVVALLPTSRVDLRMTR